MELLWILCLNLIMLFYVVFVDKELLKCFSLFQPPRLPPPGARGPPPMDHRGPPPRPEWERPPGILNYIWLYFVLLLVHMLQNHESQVHNMINPSTTISKIDNCVENVLEKYHYNLFFKSSINFDKFSFFNFGYLLLFDMCKFVSALRITFFGSWLCF